MIRTPLVASVMILLALGAGSSLADEPRVPGSPPNPRTRMNQRANVFQRLDANKDGQVSKPEFERVARKAAQKRAQGKAGGATNQGARVFNRLDTDKSGTLSPAEIEKLKQMRARQKGGR